MQNNEHLLLNQFWTWSLSAFSRNLSVDGLKLVMHAIQYGKTSKNKFMYSIPVLHAHWESHWQCLMHIKTSAPIVFYVSPHTGFELTHQDKPLFDFSSTDTRQTSISLSVWNVPASQRCVIDVNGQRMSEWCAQITI